MFSTEERRQRLASALMRSRSQTRISQEAMAAELGVAKKTVQNWEKGVSAPDFDQIIHWFHILHIPALPYLYEYLYPDLEGISAKDPDAEIRNALLFLLDTCPEEWARQLLYIFYGDHGSSPIAVLQMIVAHLQSPLHDRLAHANHIAQSYEIAKARHELTDPSHTQPNMNLLQQALKKSKDAVINGSDNYMLHDED